MILGKELKNVLINSTSNVAKSLLALETGEADWINGIDYLNIAIENPARVSYITKDRISRFIYGAEKKVIPLGKTVRLLKSSPYYHQQRGMGTIDRYEYSDDFGISGNDMNCSYWYLVIWSNGHCNSYRPADIANHNRMAKSIGSHQYELQWDADTRMKHAYMTSVGKIIGKLGIECTNKESQEFAQIFLKNDISLRIENVYFEIVKGDDITALYNQDNVYNSDGNLGNSCMRYDSSEEYVRLYGRFPEQIRMLVLRSTENSKVRGRAIIWNCLDMDGNQVVMMDRIYTNNSNHEEFFKYFAQSNRWAYKRRQSYDTDPYYYCSEDEYCGEHRIELHIYLEDCESSAFPWLDTFTTGECMGDGEVKLFNNGSGGDNFQSTDGGPYWNSDDCDDDRVWSEYDQCYYDQGETAWSDRLDSELYRDNSVRVVVSTSSPYVNLYDWMPEDHEDICHIEETGMYHFVADCIWSEHYDSHIHSTGGAIVQISDGGYVYKRDCVYSTLNSEWYLTDEAIFSDHHDSYVLNDFYDDYLNELKEKEEEVESI